MSDPSEQGCGPVLANGPFRALWLAQLLAQTSQHAIHFVQMVLIEQLTGSAVQLGLIILAFTLPGVLFSPIAGVVVDRIPKKSALALSNALRVILALSYVGVLAALSGPWRLVAIYLLTFLTATLAQFFSPAEAATIPLLVGERRLFAANSLFTLTLALSQVLGLLILGPLVVGLARVEGGFAIIAAFYAAAAVLVSTLPRDTVAPLPLADSLSGWRRFLAELTEGWQFVSTRRAVRGAIAQLVAITTLVMVMAMLAPGYAGRVLGIGPQNAVLVFTPAGAGMLLSTALVGRWGYRLRQAGFGHIALALAGLAFFLMGLASLDYQRLMQPILHVYPHARLSLTGLTMALGFFLGLNLSSANILAQTVVQRESPHHIRGRVFSVQFMLNNLVGIPPMLALGVAADTLGIPRVLQVVGVLTIALGVIGLITARPASRAAPLTPAR
jgi:MFS family permease